MITAYLSGKKLTANEKAKEIILDALDRAGYWEECALVTDLEKPITEKERQDINDQLAKKIKGVTAYLGANKAKLYYKLFDKAGD